MIDGKHILRSKTVSEISISLHPQFKNILPPRKCSTFSCFWADLRVDTLSSLKMYPGCVVSGM